MIDIAERLRLYARHFEDLHAPQNVTTGMREAAAKIEHLREEAEFNYMAGYDAAKDDYRDMLQERENEIEKLRAREKDLTLEGLALIGRIEQAREALAGTDAASLPRDYPLERMAQDRMAEIEKLRTQNAALIADNNRLVRQCEPFLSSADLKAVDKHCDWVAFGHAYRAMLNSRAREDAVHD